MVDENDCLGVQQRVGAQPALAFAVLQPEPLRHDDEPASFISIGVVQRLLRVPERLATEHGQLVEALESLLIEPIWPKPPVSSVAWILGWFEPRRPLSISAQRWSRRHGRVVSTVSRRSTTAADALVGR